MSKVTALLIGGEKHGAVIGLNELNHTISLQRKAALSLVVPSHIKQELDTKAGSDNYNLLAVDSTNRAIYVIDQENFSPSDIFINYMFGAFISKK